MSEGPTQDISQKYDTKPTLETVLLRLDELRAVVERRFDEAERRFDETDRRLDSLQAEVAGVREEMRSGFRKVERQVGILSKELLELKADHSGLEDRVEKLEESRA
ncbi:MAG TPA: hypothetical protein VGB73_15400 [Pyrinomonadaceae bacterium]|jgi:chromosome segregation ATPase